MPLFCERKYRADPTHPYSLLAPLHQYLTFRHHFRLASFSLIQPFLVRHSH